MTRTHPWRAGAWLLVMMLVLTQQLGVMHRITHGPGRGTSVGVATLSAAAKAGAVGATQWVTKLFSGHASDAGCRLFDGHGQGTAPAAPALVLPFAIALAAVLALQLAVVAVSRAPFEARGPPLLR